jgi:hypothetical protein
MDFMAEPCQLRAQGHAYVTASDDQHSHEVTLAGPTRVYQCDTFPIRKVGTNG